MWWPFRRQGRTTGFAADPFTPFDTLYRAALGTMPTTVTRERAMSVPAVRRGRNMLASISTMPLEQVDDDSVVRPSSLLRQLDLDVANVVTLAQTVEDLLFDAIAWWRITLRDSTGYPVSVRRLDPARVSLVDPRRPAAPSPLPSGIDPRDGVVWIDGKPVPGREVIRFDSPNPGLCRYAGREINLAITLAQTASTYAEDPRPADYFTPADGADDVTDDEVRGMLAKWRAARRSRATGYVPAALRYNPVDAVTPQQMQLVEMSKWASIDIANSIGIDPEDIGVSTTSRTYSNDVDRRRNRLNDVLGPYMRAITDRLSMGDVTTRTRRVRFNTSDYLLPNPTERWNNYRTASDLRAITRQEIRDAEGMGPLPAELRAPVPPPPGPAPDLTRPGGQADEQPQEAANVDASHPEPVLTLSADGDLVSFVETSTAGFTVDRERRIIEGLVLPYGQVATKGGLRFRFAQGSVLWRDETLSRVKLLREHDRLRAVGVATALRDTTEGLFARFRVARGPEGDEALTLAEDGVLDGLSVGVQFDAARDAELDRADGSVLNVLRADLKEISLTAMPSFDDARVTRVAASADDPTITTSKGDGQMPPTNSNGSGTPAPETKTDPKPDKPQSVSLSNDQLTAVLSQPGAINALVQAQQPKAEDKPKEDGSLTLSADQVKGLIDSGNLGVLLGLPGVTPAAAEPGPERVNPNPDQGRTFSVREPDPYVLDRNGNLKRGTHDFSSDIHAAFGAEHDQAAYERALGWVQAQFANIAIADVNELNPDRQRPDMYVDQLDYVTPLWDFVNRGTLQDITPFVVPKFNSSSGLVGDHTPGTEPTEGSFTTTGQTITPSAVSGKAIVNREVWDQGGNPQLSTLLWNQMLREWKEELESATGTFLNTLTAATDITITAGAADGTLAGLWNAANASLQFIRGGHRFRAFGMHIDLYKAFVAAVDGNDRPLYPIINPQNAHGTATARFGALDLGGVTGVPSWALGATGTAAANSWLFNPEDVHGWASAPERIDISYQVASVQIGIWGYKAFANTRIDGVRQVIYDPVA